MLILRSKRDGKVYGSIDNRTLHKRVYGSRHFLQKPPAIAIDAELYDSFCNDFDRIEVLDMETDTVYHLTKTDFELYRFELDRGYGRQYAVHIRKWKIGRENKPQEQLTLFAQS